MARPDLDKLLATILPATQALLEKNGEFYPVAAIMKRDGEVVFQGTYNDNETPPSQEVIDSYTNILREQAGRGEIRGAAICYDSRVVPQGQSRKVDAICTRLEHQDGEAVDVFLPYRKGILKGIKYGELFATAGTVVVFAGKDAT